MATTGSCDWRNSIAGFRNKGTVLTDEHLAAMDSKTFDDMFIGDFWVLNGHKYWIAKFSNYYIASKTKSIMMFSDTLYKAPMNETDTNEGGYYNSWMYSEGLRQAGEILAADWGDRLGSCVDMWPSKNATGNVSTIKVAAPFNCMLPTYRMINGSPYYLYPQTWYSYISNIQLPLFFYEGRNGILSGLPEGKGFWMQECMNDSNAFMAWAQNSLSTVAECKASTSRPVRVIFFVK